MGVASSLYLSLFSPFPSIVNSLDCVSCGGVKMGYYITAKYLLSETLTLVNKTGVQMQVTVQHNHIIFTYFS